MRAAAGLDAWTRTSVPVALGRPARMTTLSVADLATDETCSLIEHQAGAAGATGKAPRLTALHLAAWCLTESVVAAWAWDRAGLVVGGADLGVSGARPGDVEEVWVAARTQRTEDEDVVADVLADLLLPVVDTVGRRARVSSSVATTLASDALVAGIRAAERATCAEGRTPWSAGLLAHLDRRVPRRGRPEPLVCVPDAGPPVELPGRDLCCVLAATASSESCPGCPLVGAVPARAAHATAWMVGLDDADFRAAAGRSRKPQPGNGAT